MEINVENLNLGNVAGGELELQFQLALSECVEVFMHANQYVGGGASVTCKIKLGVELIYDPDTRALSVEGSANVVRPARRAARRQAHLRLLPGGEAEVLVEPDAAPQPTLFHVHKED